MMSSAGDPEGHEHIGDGYITYNRHRERRPRPYFPPFSSQFRGRGRGTQGSKREGKSMR
jgi:hypothetical protein